MRPTPELRHAEREVPNRIVAGSRRIFVLQQLWVSDSGEASEWRDVPVVRLPDEAT
jgi:hypothetical protein